MARFTTQFTTTAIGIDTLTCFMGNEMRDGAFRYIQSKKQTERDSLHLEKKQTERDFLHLERLFLMEPHLAHEYSQKIIYKGLEKKKLSSYL
jgi:hypothetical protein